MRSQYTRSTLWIRKDNYTYAQVDNFSDDRLIRRLSYRNVANVQNIWTPRLLEVEDMTRKSRTTLRLDMLQYNVPLNENQFTVQAFGRG